MGSNIIVINNADSLTPKIKEGAGIFTDLVGSSKSAKSPIVAGIWDVLDIDEPTPTFEAEWDEVKYVIAGELILKNHHNGEIHTLTAGSLLWIPAKSKMSIIRSRGVRVIYVEQAQRETEFGSGEP